MSLQRDNIRKNGSGYCDPTAYEAISNVEKNERVGVLVSIIHKMCDSFGFHLEERVVLKDKKTGTGSVAWKTMYMSYLHKNKTKRQLIALDKILSIDAKDKGLISRI